ncbi:MAG: type II secretion system F family protein [Thermoplasmatales archaeon]|nr:type II secretion system F family protein [Thermoplasmatales archaeon]
MFDTKSRTKWLIVFILLAVATASCGFAFQLISIPWSASCFFCASALLVIVISYFGRIIMEKEPAPREPFSKSTLNTATFALSTLWIETIIFFIVSLILKFLNLAVFVIEYIFGVLFFVTIITEIFTIFAYTKGYTRLKTTTKTIPIILAISNTVTAALSILVASDILLPSLNWGFVFSFSIFVTAPCIARYLEMPKIRETIVVMPKEAVFKGKAVIYLTLGLALPFIIFPVCYFIIQPVETGFIEWWHIATILLAVLEICTARVIYTQLKKMEKTRVIKLRSFEKPMRIGIAAASVLTGVLSLLLYIYSSVTKTGIAFEKGNISFLSVSILCFVGPFPFYEYFRFRKIDKMEEKFPDFLRDLAEYWRGGLSMSTAVGTLAKGEYGALTGEVKKMATQISWGVSFHQVLRMLNERIGSGLVNRSVSLIEEADKAGGKISDVLVTASNDAREIKWLQLERKRNTSTYMMIVYVSFFVYLGIVGVMAALFIPAITGSTKEITGGGGSIGGVSVSSINVPLMVFLFFCSAVVQGIGNGIVGGLMSEGKIVSGLRHAFIMVLVGWLVFAGAIYPIAVDLAQPGSSVEHISYWQKEPSFDITVSASDKMPGSGMDSVELFYRYSEDNYTWGNWSSYGAPDEEAPWKFKFDTKTAGGDGHYEFCSVATDVAGNTENRPVRADAKCGVDSTAPKTTINEISHYWQTENITFTAETSDKYTGINSTTLYYSFRANNATGTSWTDWISLGTYNVSNISSPRYSVDHQWNFNWTNGEGIYRFKAESIDCIDNKEQEKIDIELGYDLTPPNSTVAAMPSYWQSETFNVPYTASDNVDLKSITLHYRYSSNNINWTTWASWSGLDVHSTSVTGNFSFTATKEGYYEFRTTATDSANNKETKTITSEGKTGYDVTIPSSSVNAMPYWTNTSTTITISTYDDISDIKNVTLWYRLTWWEECIPFGVDENPPWEWVFDFPNGVGYYEFYSTANDNALNYKDYNITPEAVCAYDNITPESKVNPVDYWQNSSTFVVTASASDNISGVSWVELYYNYSADNSTGWSGWALFGTNDTTSPYEWSFNAPNGNGYYQFYSIAVDNATNIEPVPDTYDIICGVDTAKPIVSNITPIQYISNLTPLISANITDIISGVNASSIVLIVNGTDVTSSATIAQIDNGYNITYTPAALFDDGQTVNVTINASDNAGNSLPYSWSFTVDVSPPELAILTLLDGTNVTSPDVWFNGSCSDSISGVQYVEINITYTDNGSVVRPWTNTTLASNYTWWDYLFTLPLEANYTIVVKVVDNASNIQTATINISYSSAKKYFSDSISPHKTISFFKTETKIEISLREEI